jgi:glycosyltransferase involved in cell wall biosynthesis
MKAIIASQSADEWIKPEFTSGLVSVIVPTYNRADLVIQTIESLRVQTWHALEIIVVDDGSTDDTLQVLKGIPNLDDGHILRVIEQLNAGVAAARNRGTSASTGEFIIYLDSDDTLVPEAIEHYVEKLRHSGCGFCYAKIGSMDKAGIPLPDVGHWHPGPFVEGDLLTNMWQPQGACYRRSAVILAGPFNEKMAACEDHEFNLRIKWTSRGVFLPRVQGYYRIHDDGQLHVQHGFGHGFGHNFRHDLAMNEVFVSWLEQRGPIPVATRRVLVERYRFIAFRQGASGDMGGKNKALLNVERLLAGSWSLKRLYLLGRWVNHASFYGGLANLKRMLMARSRGSRPNGSLPKYPS